MLPVLSKKNIKGLVLVGLLIGDVFASPCSRIGCSCTDGHHLNCSGGGTISASAIARAVVASQVWTIDLRYRIFGILFLGELGHYFTSLKSVRVEGGPCRNIVMYLDNRVDYIIFHDCLVGETGLTTIAATAEYGYSTEPADSTTAIQKESSVHPLFQESTTTTTEGVTTTALAVIAEETTPRSTTETTTAIVVTSPAVPADTTERDAALDITGHELTYNTSAVAVARRDADMEITVHRDGSVTVLLPWITTVCLLGLILLAALLYLCCCKRHFGQTVPDPTHASGDPENPAVCAAAGVQGEGGVVSVSPSSAAVLLGNPRSEDPHTESAAQNLELAVLKAELFPDSSVAALRAALTAVETADVAVQVSTIVDIDGAGDTQVKVPYSSIATPETADVGLQISFPPPYLSEHSLDMGESFLSTGDTSDLALLDYQIRPATSSPVIRRNGAPAIVPEDISQITDGDRGDSNHAPPAPVLQRYSVFCAEESGIGDRSDVTDDLSSLRADQITEESTPSLYLSAEGPRDVHLAAVLRDSNRVRPRDAAEAAKVGAEALARARRVPRQVYLQ